MSRVEKKKQDDKAQTRARANTYQEEHLPNHVTLEFWKDLISESENFLSGLDPKVSQLWHHGAHVVEHNPADPGCQTIATKDFRLFQRSEEVRRHIYEICRQETANQPPAAEGTKGIMKPDEDVIAASYAAYSAHVVVDDMRSEEGDKFRTKMYRDFIFAIDKRYKVFRRLGYNATRIYWDVILGCWAYASDAFCVSFFPCPWIQEDALEWQPVFHKETGIQTRDLYSGANGILTNGRICQLFLRGVLVLIPVDTIDKYGCDEYRIRIMDPDYPHLDDLIFGAGTKVPDIDYRDVEGTDKYDLRRSVPPTPGELEKLTFRDLDNRRLVFRSPSEGNRPSVPLLWWQFVTAMVKIAWQIPQSEIPTKLPALHQRWSDSTWMSFHLGDHLTLGATVAFSYILNNPAGGMTSSSSSSSSSGKDSNKTTIPFRFDVAAPPRNATIIDKLLSLGSPSAFHVTELTPASRKHHIHYSPILLLCNEILQRTPHPEDAGPNTFTVHNHPHPPFQKQQQQQQQEQEQQAPKAQPKPQVKPDITAAASASASAAPAAKKKVPKSEPQGTSTKSSDQDQGIVTTFKQRCTDCLEFEYAVLSDVTRRGGNFDDLCFVHHHVFVKQPATPQGEEDAGIGSNYDFDSLWDDHAGTSKDKGKGKEEKKKKKKKTIYDDCGPCQEQAAKVRERRAQRGMPISPFIFSHHVPNRTNQADDGGQQQQQQQDLLKLSALKLG